jgi:uncharacterized protein with GYD domain
MYNLNGKVAGAPPALATMVREVDEMAKFLLHGAYTLDGMRGLLLTGGSSRRSHFAENVGKLGGKVESFYYAFGADDVYTIVDVPDNVSGLALSMALGAGGAFNPSVTVLITPEEVDEAAQKVPSVDYAPPSR